MNATLPLALTVRASTLLMALMCSLTLFPQSYRELRNNYKSYQEAGNTEAQFSTGQALILKYQRELLKDPVWYAELENHNGDYYYLHASNDSAMYAYARAVNRIYAVKADTSFDYAQYLYNLAHTAAGSGYYEKAEEYYANALPRLANFLGASSLEYTLLFKGYVEMKVDKGDFNDALPMNEALLHYFKTTRSTSDRYYLICLNNKARILQGLGQYTDAVPVFQEALQAQLNTPKFDSAGIATLYNNLGECYRMMGDYKAAEPVYQEADRLEGLIPNYPRESRAVLLNNMGLMYKAQGNYAAAESSFLKSLSFFRDAGYEQHVASTNPLNNLGDLYRLTGNYKAAVACIEQAAAIRKATSGEMHELYANALSNLALLKMDFDYVEEAEALLLQCETIYRRRLGEDHPRYANCLNNLATIYAAKRDYPKALDYRTRCLKLMEVSGAAQTDKYALYLSGRGATEFDMKRYDDAVKSFSKAAEIFLKNFGPHHLNYTDMLFSLATVNASAGRQDEATRYYLRAMGDYRRIMRDNFAVMSEEEKTDFYYLLSGRFATFYRYVMDLHAQPGFRNDSLLHSLLEVRLLDKALLLNETRQVNSTILNSADTASAALFRQWLKQKQYLQELYKYPLAELTQQGIDLEAEETARNTLEKALNKASAAFRDLTAPKDHLQELRKTLGGKNLAVELIRTALIDEQGKEQIRYAALVVSGKDRLRLVNFDSCAFFDGMFYDHYKQCIGDTVTDRLSYQRFFRSLEPFTKGASILYLSADGIYQKLNLYTLFNPVTNTYLLDTKTLTQLNSLHDLLEHRDAPASLSQAALFGFPDYNLKEAEEPDPKEPAFVSRAAFTDVPELPGTKKETEAIAELLRSCHQPATLYLGAQASEASVKALESPSILHIATHGFFLPDDNSGEQLLGFATQHTRRNPLLRSGLLLAGAASGRSSGLRNDDGVLTAYEASLLHLQHTDLVTLSACETGLGELVNAQGVYGLQRAFLTAGARSVLMSLWTVDDDATQLLMTAFYRYYLRDKVTGGKREALRRAQVEVRKQYPHPYYWGAFVLTGN